ncbi:MAG: 30S ribosomal protein S4 [Dehalococcoidia bacterium]|nr:30S ribosomal protein S4 [Dehalococcoidia bacterium]
MGRYTGPSCRLCRQVGEKLFLKAERCYTPKCAVDKRRKAPGAAKQQRRRLSDYGLRQREKQKLRYTFGLLEKQFAGYVREAQSQPGITGQYLFQLLERRLDNVVFRLGFGENRHQARQFISHGHIWCNGHKVDIPSFIVKVGDAITWKPQSKEEEFVKARQQAGPRQQLPGWLSLDRGAMEAKVTALPKAEDLDLKMDPRLIVEFYSR